MYKTIYLEPNDNIAEILVKELNLPELKNITLDGYVVKEHLLVNEPVTIKFTKPGKYYLTHPIVFYGDTEFIGVQGATIMMKDDRTVKSCTVKEVFNYDGEEHIEYYPANGDVCRPYLDKTWSNDDYFIRIGGPAHGVTVNGKYQIITKCTDHPSFKMSNLNIRIEDCILTPEIIFTPLLITRDYLYFKIQNACNVDIHNINVYLHNGNITPFVIYDSKNINIYDCVMDNNIVAEIPAIDRNVPTKDPDVIDDGLKIDSVKDGINTAGGIIWFVNNVENVRIFNNIFRKHGNDEIIAAYNNVNDKSTSVKNIAVENNVFENYSVDYSDSTINPNGHDQLDVMIAFYHRIKYNSDSLDFSIPTDGNYIKRGDLYQEVDNISIRNNTFKITNRCNTLISITPGIDTKYNNVIITGNTINYCDYTLADVDYIHVFRVTDVNKNWQSNALISGNTISFAVTVPGGIEKSRIEILNAAGVKVEMCDNIVSAKDIVNLSTDGSNKGVIPVAVGALSDESNTNLYVTNNVFHTTQRLIYMTAYNDNRITNANVRFSGNSVSGMVQIYSYNVVNSAIELSNNVFELQGNPSQLETHSPIMIGRASNCQKLTYNFNYIKSKDNTLLDFYRENVSVKYTENKDDEVVITHNSFIGLSGNFISTFPKWSQKLGQFITGYNYIKEF